MTTAKTSNKKTSNKEKPSLGHILHSTNKPEEGMSKGNTLDKTFHMDLSPHQLSRKSYATKDAKAEDCQKNTAKSSKASFHGVLAKYIFDEDNTDDEELCNNY
ncbi:hypothetical protein Clacol_005122 [Clathrus columnatus]|uniref:Uncharacterized protein n=1 Tax=Clathrus columnatus TaxID=1419009 RepID=A0AAV5ACH3_9AGAM|nr:hypothetical protein Clacol_005122 [Clathrus columnatus]